MILAHRLQCTVMIGTPYFGSTIHLPCYGEKDMSNVTSGCRAQTIAHDGNFAAALFARRDMVTEISVALLAEHPVGAHDHMSLQAIANGAFTIPLALAIA